MINHASLQAVSASRWKQHFLKPLYDSYCFARIPQVVEDLFTPNPPSAASDMLLGPLAGSYDHVILLFIDAFGWRFFQQFQDRYPFLQRFVLEGMVTKLTSQFPSTTAAHMTTINTGLSVGQSGVYEWFYYEPLVDAIIAPLIFAYAGDTDGSLLRAGIDPSAFFPTTNLHQRLQQQGVTSYSHLHRSMDPSPYGAVVGAGSQSLLYATWDEAFATLVDAITQQQRRSYHFLYFDRIDSAGHRYGTQTPQFAAQVDVCFTALEQVLHAGLFGKGANTLLLLTADHGQTDISPAATIYLNLEFPDLLPWLKRNRAGQILAPAGSCRDMFLYIQPEHLDEAHAYLQAQLAGRAEVHRVRELIAQGFFGSEPPSSTFLGRVGDLVVLSYSGESVWWFEKGRFEQRYFGHHGGLTPDELEIPFLALPYK